MDYAIVGHGRMGRAIRRIADGRGHRCLTVVERRMTERPSWAAEIDGCDLAFEFTNGSVAEAHVRALLGGGLSVVCGTTGWTPSPGLDAEVDSSGNGLMLAPNFSLGVGLFARVVRVAAEWIGRAGQHHPYLWECHHAAKIDAPSGTARHLAQSVVAADPRLRGWQPGIPPVADRAHTLSVTSVRVGHEPGEHVLGFDGEHDTISLRHDARSRDAFALGAVLAAEWLIGRSGRYTLDDLLDDLLESSAHGAPDSTRRNQE